MQLRIAPPEVGRRLFDDSSSSHDDSTMELAETTSEKATLHHQYHQQREFAQEIQQTIDWYPAECDIPDFGRPRIGLLRRRFS
jgi:hypothetical protein